MFENLGQYRILDRIGSGGLGEVYRARDTRFGRTVAIKVLPADLTSDPERREQLLSDARAAATLSHPNIATLYEIGEDQGHLFLVFEFVPGQTLKSIVGGHPMNPRRAIDLGVQIADALADGHAVDIVHGDLKPDNVIVTPKGNAKVLDFGLARWTGGGSLREKAVDGEEVALAESEALRGTVAYLSPEQALGERVDARTDIFSLGIMLFEMLTGKLPFTGTTSAKLALQIVQATPPQPSAVERTLPHDVDPIVAKALGKSFEQRYESVATLAAELRSVAAVLEVRTAASEPPSRPAAIAPPRTSPLKWFVLAVIFAALAAVMWWQGWLRF